MQTSSVACGRRCVGGLLITGGGGGGGGVTISPGGGCAVGVVGIELNGEGPPPRFPVSGPTAEPLVPTGDGPLFCLVFLLDFPSISSSCSISSRFALLLSAITESPGNISDEPPVTIDTGSGAGVLVRFGVTDL